MKPASPSSRSYCDAAVLASLSLTISLHAVEINKANNTDNLNVGTSWSGGTTPGTADVGVWNNTVIAANTTALGGDLSWSGIKIANPAGAVTINTGNTLTLGSAGIDMSAATQNLTLNAALTLGAGQTWTVASGRTLTAAGTVGGSAGLIKAGTGSLTLTGVKGYSGGTTINDGTLKVDMTASTGSQTLGAVTINGGVYELFNTNTTVDGTLVPNSAFSGTGTLRKTGAGYLDLTFTGSNINSFGGTLDVQAGTLGFNQNVQGSGNATLQIASGALVDVRTGTLKIDALNGVANSTVYVSYVNGGTLNLGNNNGTGAFAGTLAAGGSALTLVKNGTGTQTFSGANNHTGTTTINNGTLKLVNPAAWTSPVALATTNSPNLELNAPLAADAWSFGKQISGANAAAAVKKTGAGTVTLTAAQTYTGATQVNEGKLILSNVLPTGFPTISGMRVWLDGADPDGNGVADSTNGTSLSTWVNKGTLGAPGNFTAVQTGSPPTFTASSAAFNNKGTVTFSAAGQQLANGTNFTNNLSVIYVGRIGATKQRLVSGNTVNWLLGYWNGNMNTNYWNGGNLGSTADTNAHIWISGATGGAYAGYRLDAAGEVSIGTGSGAAPTAGLMLGGGWAGGEKSDGEIAELFVFDHQLTTTERQQLEGYLYNKYFGSPFGIISLNSASPVSVANGATFGGYGSAGNIAVNGGMLEGGSLGSGALTAGTVTTSGASTLKGSLSPSAGSPAFSVSDLAITGGDQSLLINATGTGLTNGGTYDLLVSTNAITAPGATSVQAALKSTSRLYTPMIDATGKKIQVTYDANSSVYWTGAAGTAWDAAASNWKLSGNNNDTQFQANDVVYFHDSPVSSVVDISGADVNPAATTFDNTATAYTLQGSNGIATGTITKTNGGALAITNTNPTTGDVSLNGGTTSLSQSGGLGTGNISFGGGALNYGGSSTTWSRNFTLNATGTVGIGTAATTLTHTGTVAGTGGLTKTGDGTLSLGGSNGAWTGSSTVSQGVLVANHAATMGAATNTLTLGDANTGAGSPGFTLGTGLSATVPLASVSNSNYGTAPTITINAGGSLPANQAALVTTLQLNGSTPVTLKATNTGGHSTAQDVNWRIEGNGIPAGTTALTLDGTSYALRTSQQGDASAASNFTGDVLIKGNVTTQNRTYLTATAGNQNLGFLNNDVTVNTGANWVIVWGGETTGALNGAGNINLNNQNALNNIGLTLGNNNRSGTYTGSISGGFGVAKKGTGTQTFASGNSYGGGTTIDNGALLVTNSTGSGTGGGAVTVNATGTLGGTGSASGAVTAAGTLAPGTTGTGTLTTGAVTLTGTYACQIDGANCDKLAVNGSLSLTGATLAISTISAPTAPSYLIATYTGATPTFTTVTGMPAGYALDTSTPGQIKLMPPYDSWAASKGLTGANGGKHQNPDGDSLDNLMEYAFGTDPLVSSNTPIAWSGGTVTSAGSPTTSITNNGNSVDFRAVFGRRKDYLAAGLVYTVQFSADLSQWVDSTTTPAAVATGTEIDAVSVPYPLFIPTSRGTEKPTFFRVSVTENP